jgi:excisionase family DNA binding protein
MLARVFGAIPIVVRDRRSRVMTIPRLLTVEQIAAATSSPVSSVRSWIYSGRLRSLKVGRRRLVAEPALEAFLGLTDAGGTAGHRKRTR